MNDNDTSTFPNHNRQQYDVSNNSDIIPKHQQYDALTLDNIPHYNNQQPNTSNTSNNVSPSQFYPPQSNIFPLLNSLGITRQLLLLCLQLIQMFKISFNKFILI